MKALYSFEAIYFYRHFVDMRKSINGLSALVVDAMGGDFKKPHLFVFCNRRRNLMKMIYFDRSGFALWMKRLESHKFPWPRDVEEDAVYVSSEDMELLLSGINIWTRFEKVGFEEIL